MKIIQTVLLCGFVFLSSLKAEEYLVTINGVSSEMTSGKETVITLPDGVKLNVNVEPKPFACYSGMLCSFEYNSSFKPEISKDRDGDLCATFMSREGASMVVLEFLSTSPETMIDDVMKELTKKEVARGYSNIERKIIQSASGVLFPGKEAVVSYQGKEKIYRVYLYRSKDGGIFITIFFNKEDEGKADEFVERVWKTMKIMNKANQALVPTLMSVTPAARAPGAPATGAAHL